MQTPAVLALLLVQLLFGALPVASKFVLAHAHPLFVVTLRSLFATVFFVLLSALFSGSKSSAGRGAQPETEATKSGLPFSVHLRILVLAFFGITFNQMALFIALPNSSAAVTSIISPSIALFTLVFSVLLGRESFRLISFSSILLGGSGVFMVVNPYSQTAHSPAGSGEHWADLLNVLSAASYAFYLALVSKLPARLGTLRFSAWFFVYGLFMNLIVMAVYAKISEFGWIASPASLTLSQPVADLPLSFWNGLLFLLLGATAMTYFLNMWAIQRVKPSLVGGFVCLQTIFGLFLSGKILKEPLTRNMIHGSALILCGVLLLAFQHYRESKRETRVRLWPESDFDTQSK